MAQCPPWLTEALGHQHAGRVTQAEGIYNDILRAAPAEPDALNFLGLSAASRRQFPIAEALISRAIALRPRRGDFRAALGNVFLAQGEDAKMTECYRDALLLLPFTQVPASFAELASHAGNVEDPALFPIDAGFYASQCLQDVYLDRWVFHGMRDGVFVDVGAHDGVTFSNSCFFERARGWTGVCIEPNPTVFERLRANRRCTALNCCVAAEEGRVSFRKLTGYSEMLSGIAANYRPEHRDRVEAEIRQHGGTSEVIEVEARSLAGIAGAHGISEISYLSIDTEGSEWEILQSIDFERRFVHALTVECNFGEEKARIVSLLRAQGFEPIIDLGSDVVFLNRRSRHFATLPFRAKYVNKSGEFHG
jgi:FkbM family methyltransferase